MKRPVLRVLRHTTVFGSKRTTVAKNLSSFVCFVEVIVLIDAKVKVNSLR